MTVNARGISRRGAIVLLAASLSTLPVACIGGGGGGGGSGKIRTVTQARGYLEDVIRGAGASKTAATDAALATKRMVDRAERIEDARQIASEADYSGWACDGLDVFQVSTAPLGPSRQEVMQAIQDSRDYDSGELLTAGAFVDDLDPGGLNAVTKSEALKLADSVCKFADSGF